MEKDNPDDYHYNNKDKENEIKSAQFQKQEQQEQIQQQQEEVQATQGIRQGNVLTQTTVVPKHKQRNEINKNNMIAHIRY